MDPLNIYFYVDDVYVVCRSMLETDRLKTQLGNKFEMKDLGKARKI